MFGVDDLPPLGDPLGTIGVAWRRRAADGDWRAGVARAAAAAAGTRRAGLVTESPAAQVALGGPIDAAECSLIRARLAHGEPCAVCTAGDGGTIVAAAIGEGSGDLLWVRRSSPFGWQEVLALRHVAALAAPLHDLDRRRAEAELRLDELQHRCGNDLQLVASLLGAHARHAPDDAARDALLGAAEQIGALVRARRLPEDDLPAALRGFCDALSTQAHARGILLSLSVEGELRAVSRARGALVLIAVNELVTNAIKHGFADHAGGVIHVAARSVGDALEVAVADDGAPMPEGRAAMRSGSGLDLVGRLLAGGRGALALPQDTRKRFVVTMPMT